MPIAKKATKSDTYLKVMAWGDPGSGKTRLALSFPAPILIDLERGSRLYADQFDFLVAEPTPELPGFGLVKAVVDEIARGEYPDRRTLIIDPITDYLDQLEVQLLEAKKKNGVNLDALRGLQAAKVRAEVKDAIKDRLDILLRLPLHIVLVARVKNNWEGSAVVGQKADANDLVESLCDVVLHIKKGGTAVVQKSRIAELPDTIKAATYSDLEAAVHLSSKPKAPPAAPTAAPSLPDIDAPAITPNQLQRLALECKRVFGETEADAARSREFLSKQVGREIVSRKALTEAEAAKLIKQLEATPNGKLAVSSQVSA